MTDKLPFLIAIICILIIFLFMLYAITLGSKGLNRVKILAFLNRRLEGESRFRGRCFDDNKKRLSRERSDELEALKEIILKGDFDE